MSKAPFEPSTLAFTLACARACSGIVGSRALAQEQAIEAQAPEQPQPHALATLSFGAPLRITRNVDLDQNVIAPAFMDVLLGYTFLNGSIQHGLGLGLSLNLSEEGGFTEPVGIANQLVLMPTYLGYRAINRDWVLLGHFGVPLVLTGTTSAGLELALGAGYRFLAGVLAYAELGVDAFLGASSTLHATVSLELGFMLDYEVLP